MQKLAEWVAKGRRAARRGWAAAWVWVTENRLLAASLLVSAAGLIAGVLVALFLGSWLTGTGPGEETGSTTLGNLGISLVALVALPLAVWRGKSADRQAKTAELALLNEHYQRGVELLRSDVLSDCLTGIDALRSLAEEYPQQYHIRIMALLCTFVRRPGKAVAPPPRVALPSGSRSSRRQETHELREDVQAAIEAICTCHAQQLRRRGKIRSPLNLSGARLQRLRLRDTSLFRAELRGADLTEAQLPHVDLRGARLEDAILVSADLRGSDLTASRRISTSLTRADLTNARLMNSQMGGVSLRHANLTGTRFVNGPGSGTPTGAAVGLTQGQLDRAFADPDKPPRLEGVKDRDSGEQLVPPRNPEGWERYQRRREGRDGG